MPNWCDNSAHLRNIDIAKIDALEAELSKKNDEGRSMAELFTHLCPNPAGKDAEGWYDWNCNNWGTKWDANIIDWDRSSDDEMIVYFETAWSPPIALYEYLTEQGWEVEALYHESGCAYAGQFIDGDDNYFEYDRTDKQSIDDLPMDLIDFAGLENAHEEWKEEAVEEYLTDMERTEWFPKKVKPAYEGRYEVTTKAWTFPQYCNWTGEKWQRWSGDEIVVTQWRGLTEEFTDVKYQEMLDTITESN